uniref:Uncharacterized protein n=1 Tax=Moorena producens (strain JHB) TaxID=1454205 RepID=A0A1D9G6U1_MOOP1
MEQQAQVAGEIYQLTGRIRVITLVLRLDSYKFCCKAETSSMASDGTLFVLFATLLFRSGTPLSWSGSIKSWINWSRRMFESESELANPGECRT